MVRTLSVVLLSSFLSCSAVAQGIDRKDVARSIELKNGQTVYIFNDGRMAYEDRFGRPIRVKTGDVLETKNGGKLTVKSDDEGRLLQLEPRN